MKFMKSNSDLSLSARILTTLMILGGATPAFSATSPWQEFMGSRMRLISAGSIGGKYKAGLEVDLADGWKTYWKVPGDSGIPPLLDFSSSRNAENIDFLWPVPSRIKAGDTHILGYKDAIIFPFLITPTDTTNPVHLALDAQIGLCAELCVPLNAQLDLDIASGGDHDPGSELLIDRDLALVPQKPRPGFSILSMQQEKREQQPDRLLITAEIPDGFGHKDMFVEGPEDWFLPLTSLISPDDARKLEFELVLDGLPDGATTEGQKLTFTLTNGDEAIEQSFALER